MFSLAWHKERKQGETKSSKCVYCPVWFLQEGFRLAGVENPDLVVDNQMLLNYDKVKNIELTLYVEVSAAYWWYWFLSGSLDLLSIQWNQIFLSEIRHVLIKVDSHMGNSPVTGFDHQLICHSLVKTVKPHTLPPVCRLAPKMLTCHQQYLN